jgi:nitrogen fixation protein FixH
MTTIENVEPPKSYAPWYFVGFFVLLAIMDGIFVTIATRTHTGVVTDDAYNEGLAYNDTIAAVEAQQALGWQNELVYDAGTVTFKLSDSASKPIANAAVRAIVARPIEADKIFELALSETAAGQYTAAVDTLDNGQWDIRVFVEWQQQKYQMHERLIIR